MGNSGMGDGAWAAFLWLAVAAVHGTAVTASFTDSAAVVGVSVATGTLQAVSDENGQSVVTRRLSQAINTTDGSTTEEIHCVPYTGCDNSRACPSCALGPETSCQAAPGDASASAACSCEVHRPLDNCEFGDYCFQRCLNSQWDYVFRINANPPTTTATTTTGVPTSTAATTTLDGTSTATTATTATTTATSTTTDTRTTSTFTTTLAMDLAAMTGTQVREVARSAEEDIASLLLASNGTTLTMYTPVATVIAQLVDSSQMASNGNASLQVPNSTVSISVPAAVLQAMGGSVIMSIAAFNESAMGSFEPTYQGRPLGAPPVSVRLRSASTLQDANFGNNLPGPIVIEMLSSAPPEARCGYWDVARAEWSSAGLTRIGGENGTFACATTHLTIFAMILGEFERVFICSNAHVFSDEGIRAIARGDWWNRAPAWILWIILATQLMLLGWAAVTDFLVYYKATWRDVDFLTSNEAFSGREDSCRAWLREAIGRYLPGPEIDIEHAAGEKQPKRRGCWGCVRSIIDSITITMTADCAAYEVAQKERIAPDDLRDIVLGAPGALEMEQQMEKARPPPSCTQCGTEYAEGERFCPSCGHRREVPNASAEESWKALKSSMSREAHGLADTIRAKVVPEAVDGLRASFCSRLWRMFVALHPWVQLRQFSITFGTSIRTLMLTGKILGAFAVCCLFFDTYGTPLAKGMPESCNRTGFWEHFWRNVVLGLVSTTLSLVPLLIISSLSNRRFIYQETWNTEMKRSYVQCWRTQDALLVSMALLYCGVCILYCLAFLANIDPSVEGEWLTSAVVVLIREFFLVPFALAAVYAAVATCVTKTRPELDDVVHHKVEDIVGLNVPEEEISDPGVNEGAEDDAGSENESWADRVNSLGPDAYLNGPSDALEALNEDEIPLPHLGDLEVDDASRIDPETPSKAGLDWAVDLLPHMPEPEELKKEAKPPPPPPCPKCGSRMWASFHSEICPMCGHLLPFFNPR